MFILQVSIQILLLFFFFRLHHRHYSKQIIRYIVANLSLNVAHGSLQHHWHGGQLTAL